MTNERDERGVAMEPERWRQERQQPSISGRVSASRAVLHVHVLRGRNMHDADPINAMDPFLLIVHGTNASRSLAKIHGGTDCDFDWSAAFPFDPLGATAATEEGDMEATDSLPRTGIGRGLIGAPPPPRHLPALEICVIDQNRGRRDSEVGRGSIPHTSLLRCETKENTFRGSIHLVHHGYFSDLPAGELDVEVWWERSPPDEPFPVPLLHCVSNHNLGGGLIRKVLDGGRFQPFRTWQMNLWLVDTVFGGERCVWNGSYAKARAIYGKGPAAWAVRRAIRVQNAHLYSTDRHSAMYEVTEVRGIRDFLHMLPSSHDVMDYSPVRFTYVITCNSLFRFSVTGYMIGQDVLSKHALHADAAEEVVYAGEFFVDRKSERSLNAWGSSWPTLVIDNNSGTFAPPKERLTKLKALLELNLGEALPILALDRDDPLLRELIKENGIV